MRRRCRVVRAAVGAAVPGVCLLSLVACVGVGWLWWRSYRVGSAAGLFGVPGAAGAGARLLSPRASVGTGWLWWRSPTWSDQVTARTGSGWEFSLVTSPGRARVWVEEPFGPSDPLWRPPAEPVRPSLRVRSVGQAEYGYTLGVPSYQPTADLLGIRVYHDPPPDGVLLGFHFSRQAWGVGVPLWMLSTATALPPLLWLTVYGRREWVRRRRTRLGLTSKSSVESCRRCGYDLRGSSSGVCPACGTAAVAARCG